MWLGRASSIVVYYLALVYYPANSAPLYLPHVHRDRPQVAV
jgi:hypothetical protein